MTQHIDNTRGTSPLKKRITIHLYSYMAHCKGMGLNPVLDSSEHISLAFTMPKYTMYDLGAFPCLTDNGDTLIVGDLYSVDSDTLSQLDVIEGVLIYIKEKRERYNHTETSIMFKHIFGQMMK